MQILRFMSHGVEEEVAYLTDQYIVWARSSLYSYALDLK